MPSLLEAAETSEESKKRLDPDGILDYLQSCKKESEQYLTMYHQRWAKNIRLIKGIFSEAETNKSKVRGRSKLFFRKIWSNDMRLMASLYQAFLKDPDNFRITGRGAEDELKAAVLTVMTEYHRDRMMRNKSFFRKMINGFLDILDSGFAPGIIRWVSDGKNDGPDFKSFPPEQCFPDLAAETADEMDYVIFEDWMTKSQMKAAKFEHINDVQPVVAPYNIVRSTRNMLYDDPVSNTSPNEYPAPGTHNDKTDSFGTGKRYKIHHAFYKKDGISYYCVVSGDFTKRHLKEKKSIYGDKFPVVLGLCLPVAHKLIGEAFPEVQEGAQESYNDTINRRKDNVAIFMNRGTIVSRYGGVDLQSLVNSRPGAVTLANNVDAVKERAMGDITQSAYVEAQSEDAMMQELSGVTDIKIGNAKNEKATTAAINQSEAGAKHDFFLAMVAETYVREIFSMIASQIQKFESDKDVFRIANQKLREKNKNFPEQDIYEIDDFEADCVVDVSPAMAGRETEIRQTMLGMDRAIMANQSTFAILKTGIVPPDGLDIINVSQFWKDYMAKVGHKNTDKYIVKLPPPQEPPGPLSGAETLLGRMHPNAGNPEAISNDMQGGGLGG